MTKDDCGAGTVLALGLIAVALSVFALVASAVSVGRAQLEAQALADRIVLAADDALRGALPTPPCRLASQISAESSAELDTCRIVEKKVFIELHLYRGFGFSANALKLRVQASAAAAPAGN